MIAPSRNNAPRSRGNGDKARIAVWGTLAIVVIAVAFVFCLPQDARKETQDKDTKRGEITEVTPVLTMRPTQSEEQVAHKEEPKKPLPPQRVGELRDGYRLLPDGTLHHVLGIVTNTPPKMSLADKTFTHSADVELGNLLMVEPGDDLLGDSEGMYKGFNKELDEALAEPIYYDKDDTDIQRELKEGVNELRNELVERRKNGEDIEKLMEDTRNQLKELALYKQELEDQVRSLSTEELTQKDYEDLIAAANQMLADRGINPLELPSTLKRAIRLRQIQENAERKQKEKENAVEE